MVIDEPMLSHASSLKFLILRSTSLDTFENPRLHEIEAFLEKHGFNLILAKNKFENCYDAVFQRTLN